MGEPGLDAAYRISRAGEDETVIVLEDKVFTPEEASIIPPASCRWWEPSDTYCYDYPDFCEDCNADGYDDCFGTCVKNAASGAVACVEDYCEKMPCAEDCDGDGTGDCDGWCQTIYTFEIIDSCVPPGTYDYHILYRDTPGGDWSDISWNEARIDVTPVDEACTPPSTEANDSDGCGIVTTGRWRPDSVLKLLHRLATY